MVRIALIFVGGGVGSVLRYLLAVWLPPSGGTGFPWGTLAANVLGCAAIGFLATALSGPWEVRPDYRFALLVGLLGGFTTFSTFGWETVSLAGEGAYRMAFANVMLSNVLGFSAAWLMHRVALAMTGGMT